MNGVEYYRDRRVDRSQYKGLSFRLRDGVLELARLRGPSPGCPRGGVGCRRAPTASTSGSRVSRQDGYSSCVRPVPRAIAAKRQQSATMAWRMR